MRKVPLRSERNDLRDPVADRRIGLFIAWYGCAFLIQQTYRNVATRPTCCVDFQVSTGECEQLGNDSFLSFGRLQGDEPVQAERGQTDGTARRSKGVGGLKGGLLRGRESFWLTGCEGNERFPLMPRRRQDFQR